MHFMKTATSLRGCADSVLSDYFNLKDDITWQILLS